jgi:hypothetical protein
MRARHRVQQQRQARRLGRRFDHDADDEQHGRDDAGLNREAAARS